MANLKKNVWMLRASESLEQGVRVIWKGVSMAKISQMMCLMRNNDWHVMKTARKLLSRGCHVQFSPLPEFGPPSSSYGLSTCVSPTNQNAQDPSHDRYA